MIVLQLSDQFLRFRILHQREPEPYLSEVLYRCTDQIDGVVDYKKPVVCLGKCPDRYRRILCIVLVEIQLQLL